VHLASAPRLGRNRKRVDVGGTRRVVEGAAGPDPAGTVPGPIGRAIRAGGLTPKAVPTGVRRWVEFLRRER
jgi:hypothetical protein